MRMLTPMRAYSAVSWVKGKQSAATRAAARVTLRCLAVSAVSRAMSPARVSAVKAKAAVMRKPMNCSESSVGMSIP